MYREYPPRIDFGLGTRLASIETSTTHQKAYGWAYAGLTRAIGRHERRILGEFNGSEPAGKGGASLNQMQHNMTTKDDFSRPGQTNGHRIDQEARDRGLMHIKT